MQTEPDSPGEKPKAVREHMVVSQPDFDRPVKPVAELVAAPDFPKSALGEYVDIGGYTGVVVEIVNQSLKVRSQDGITQSFNAHGLRRIYGPVVRPDPVPEQPAMEVVEPVRATRPEPTLRVSRTPPAPPLIPKREPTVEPDFTKPVKKISDFVTRTDYPQCLLGEHLEIGGYTGVVVQIVNRSLKVRSPAEITRSYNADALRKLHAEL